MTEFEFFANREERWGDSMRALWGNLSICPLLDHIDLPYHTAGELLSISHLKVWGDTQKPWDGMAYLLVKVEDASEVKGYGMALVWISPHQAQASMMEEALEILCTWISSGPDWPYILTQLYEGTNHATLPKDKHLGILPQWKAESPCGQISQLEVHQLLSTRLRVVYPMGLNRGNKSVTIDLPGLLHSGSSVTTAEHPYIKIDIPSPIPEEEDGVNLPLGGGHATQAIAMPKTPWKPRVTLMAEVGELLTWGMTEDYDHEPEHSTMVKELTAKTDISAPLNMEVPALPLDMSSQVSVPETEASIESNPVHNSPTAVAYSSCSDSLTMDLPELQADTHLAINHMLSIKRSSDLERQWAIWDFKASLHQWEAEAAAANERAKIVHSRKDLQARVKCTKVVMKAKYDYRVAVQEARVVRCNELKEAEAAYSDALHENAASKSLHCATLCREHAKYMSQLDEQALEVENRNWQDFLSTHLAVLHHAPPSLKEDLHSSYNILLGNLSLSLQSIPSARAPQTQGWPPVTTSPKSEPIWSPQLKRCHSSTDAQGDMSIDESSPITLQEGPSNSKRGKTTGWSSILLKPSHVDAFSWDSSPIKEARECYLTAHPWDWARGNTDDLSDIFREFAQGAGFLGEFIHEIQVSWNGPEEVKHANYILRSLPKGLKFLRVVSTKESPKIMGLKGIHDSDLPVILTACGAAKMDRMRGTSSTTWGQYIINWASYVISVSDGLQWCRMPSTNMDATPAQIKVLSPGVCPESKGDVIY